MLSHPEDMTRRKIKREKVGMLPLMSRQWLERVVHTTGPDAKPVTAAGIALLTSVLWMKLCMNIAGRHRPTDRGTYHHKALQMTD